MYVYVSIMYIGMVQKTIVNGCNTYNYMVHIIANHQYYKPIDIRVVKYYPLNVLIERILKFEIDRLLAFSQVESSTYRVFSRTEISVYFIIIDM